MKIRMLTNASCWFAIALAVGGCGASVAGDDGDVTKIGQTLCDENSELPRGYDPDTATLVGRAVLPADTFAPGPPCGAFSDPNNGRTPPYPSQVVLGISSMLRGEDGSFWAMPDNGFGSKGNSVDFLLRLYRFTPNWETGRGGGGTIDVGRFLSLRDPDHKIPFAIVNDASNERLLTGGDFDVESVTRGHDGSLWIGDEFGPFLLHFDGTGKLLEAPIAHPSLKAPQNPFLAAGEQPNVRSSRGYEALAITPDGKFLYPAVEGSLVDDTDPLRRYILEFDVKRRRYTGRSLQYRTDGEDYRIGDMQSIDAERMILIEREDLEGPAAIFKRVYLVDRRKLDKDGFLVKRLVADLLNLKNPAHIGDHSPGGGFGLGDPFKFPLQSVETLLPLDDSRILVTQDNNYPDSNGRVAGTPDGTEMILIDFGKKHHSVR